jgi:hypothetical protein
MKQWQQVLTLLWGICRIAYISDWKCMKHNYNSKRRHRVPFSERMPSKDRPHPTHPVTMYLKNVID